MEPLAKWLDNDTQLGAPGVPDSAEEVFQASKAASGNFHYHTLLFMSSSRVAELDWSCDKAP